MLRRYVENLCGDSRPRLSIERSSIGFAAGVSAAARARGKQIDNHQFNRYS
jgi:hypothetical protein